MKLIKFNLSLYKEAGRKRIKDRNIRWEEMYHEKSLALKKRFIKILGEGAYFRWEGHDYTTNSDYFVVVGPAIERSGKKSFFAGIKKLPPGYKRHTEKSYAPSGKYFSAMASALSHAVKMWGISFPKQSTNYTDKDLAAVKIPRHMKG
jgi:hypothetical protein